ncbi:MAG: Peptidase family S9-like protein [Ignavibacteria bacterium]|nr:Peptidase family S9-like protein [Ignavibacteria bacterium]
MKKNIQKAIPLFLLFISLSCSENTSSGGFGKINVMAVNFKTGQPIVNGFVNTDPGSSTLLTNSEGKVEIPTLNSGYYFVYVKKDGYYNGFETVRVNDGQTSQIVITMLPSVEGNNPPNQPQITSPVSNATIKTKSVSVNWSCSDIDNDAVTYDVYCDVTKPPTKKVAFGIKAKSVIVTDLKDSYDYYCMVVAKDVFGATSMSLINEFKVKNASDTTNQNPNPNLTQGLVLNFTFNGNANDQSGNNLNGNLYSGVSFTSDRRGYSSSAIFLSGNSGSKVTVTQTSVFDFTNFTLSCWIKPDFSYSVPYNNYIDVISRWGTNTYMGSSYLLGIGSDRTVRFSLYSGSYQVNGYSKSTIPNNTWSHIAMTYTNSSVRIFINGVLDGVYEGVNPQTSSYALTIGARSSSSQPSYFAGAIDDVYIYNRALTDVELLALYNK